MTWVGLVIGWSGKNLQTLPSIDTRRNESQYFLAEVECLNRHILFFVLPLHVLAAIHQNGLSMNQMLLGLSPNVLPGPKEGDLAGHEGGHDSKRMHLEKGSVWVEVVVSLHSDWKRCFPSIRILLSFEWFTSERH